MAMTNFSGYQAYKKNKYETASPHKLILMLYDGALTNLHLAADALDKQDHISAHGFLIKSQEILSELLSCLNTDQGGQIAENLKQIYLYSINQLAKANVQKDRALVDEVEGCISELRSAWAAIGKEVGLGTSI